MEYQKQVAKELMALAMAKAEERQILWEVREKFVRIIKIQEASGDGANLPSHRQMVKELSEKIDTLMDIAMCLTSYANHHSFELDE